MPTVLGRIIWGSFSDLVGREMAMVIPFTLQALCLVGVLSFGRLSSNWFIVMMVLVFFTWGSMFSLFPAIIGDYFGPKCATSNYGFLYTAKGVASIGGGGVAAALFTKYGSWNIPVYWTAALTLVSAVLILVLRFIPLPRLSRQAQPALGYGQSRLKLIGIRNVFNVKGRSVRCGLSIQVLKRQC